MANIVRRTPRAVHPDQRLSAEIADAERPAVLAAARIHAAAFTTSGALHHAAILSRTADACFKVSPMGEDVYRALLMAYGDYAVMEIQALGLRGRGR